MTAQEYIIHTLEDLSTEIVAEDVGSAPLEDAIYAKVMSKKFRKLRVDEQAVSIVKTAIRNAVKANKPITVGLLFGGNKLWRFDEAPEVDWAELLSALYYLRWMKSIASVYKPGAHFDYYSQDISVATLNNIPLHDTEQYTKTFKAMLQWLQPYLPTGVTVGYRRHADEYSDRAAYLKELEDAKKIVLAENNGALPSLSDAQKAATELNVKLSPGQAADPQWREKVELEHQAIFYTKSLLPYLHDENLIPTCPTPYEGLIATGSTKKSIAKFWAGVGALEKTTDDYNELVLTPKQLQAVQFAWKEVHLEGLEGKNFKKIRIIG